MACHEQGKLDEAAACYRRALELKPDYAEAYNNLGNTLKDQGRPDEAAACCRRAVELRPDYAEAHYNLGNALKDQGKPEEAVACYRRALERKPELAEAHNNLGAALSERGKLDEAIACYRRALELKPEHAEAHGNLGALWKRRAIFARRKTSSAPRWAQRPVHVRLLQIGGGAGREASAGRRGGRAPVVGANGAGRRRADVAALQPVQVLDARGEYDEAAEHLARGNRLQLAEWREARPGVRPEGV